MQAWRLSFFPSKHAFTLCGVTTLVGFIRFAENMKSLEEILVLILQKLTHLTPISGSP